ncbi:MAG TPA: ATP-binding protein [Candidatus Deferrimicrobium sp.]|nr:ATP-binding protein [Candidatus Deferrimicrobium sp.]
MDHQTERFQLAYYDDKSTIGNFIKNRQPTFDEYLIILLSLVPHIQPEFLDKVIKDAIPESGNFPEIGGTRNGENRGFVPTAETALFLLAGDDLDKRFEVQRIFSSDHWLARDGVLLLEPAKEGQPYWSGRLLLNPEYIELFTLGRVTSPPFGAAFPAREIHTEMEWDDLVLSADVLEQIEHIKHWVEHNDTLMQEWGMRRILRPGYRVLFYGPPGTGKTLTATLLGKYTSRQVFRIDLSTVVSKYIGETEKNLASLFDKARHKKWILFFDEADALFGKRTDVKDAHDRYANQEVSYLLQRVEEFEGLVILASNFKANLDEAFVRRFNAIVRFPFPTEAERVRLWRNSLPKNARAEAGVDLPTLLGKFELAGGSIINVVQHASLEAITRGSDIIHFDDALNGIRREIEKEGKVFKNLLTIDPGNGG